MLQHAFTTAEPFDDAPGLLLGRVRKQLGGIRAIPSEQPVVDLAHVVRYGPVELAGLRRSPQVRRESDLVRQLFRGAPIYGAHNH